MDIDLKVAQLLVSRVCHDLAGGVSAVNAGVELIDESGGEIDPEALSLIDGSAKQTVSRLSFFRSAFGFGGGAEDAISISELGALSSAYIEGGRIRLNWPDTSTFTGDDAKVGLAAGKVLLNLVLLAVDALPRGGTIQVDVSKLDGATGFALVVRGENAALGDELVAALNPTTDAQTLSARTVHAYFAATLVENLKGEIEYTSDSSDPAGDLSGEVHLAAIIPHQP